LIYASLIIPIRNEEKSVSKLIDTILNQTVNPKEIIFVDGHSKDNTINIIKKYIKKYPLIKLYSEPKSNKKGKIAVARNFAIAKSNCDYIVCVDAGCVLEPNWFENMIKPFEKGYDVVIGNYLPLIKNDFDYYQSLVSVNSVIDSKGKIILSRASSRSLAFKKKSWKLAGKYPEDTYTGEDTKYNFNLQNVGSKFYFAKDAKLYWNMRSNIKDFIKQYFLYGKGDALSKNIFKLKLNFLFFIFLSLYIFIFLILLFIVPLYSLFLILLIIMSFFMIGLKLNYNFKLKKFINGLYYIPFLLFLKRISYYFGLWSGFLVKL
jgi:glycosyltransferase involved in cell wall biosynthesis